MSTHTRRTWRTFAGITAVIIALGVIVIVIGDLIEAAL